MVVVYGAINQDGTSGGILTVDNGQSTSGNPSGGSVSLTGGSVNGSYGANIYCGGSTMTSNGAIGLTGDTSITGNLTISGELTPNSLNLIQGSLTLADNYASENVTITGATFDASSIEASTSESEYTLVKTLSLVSWTNSQFAPISDGSNTITHKTNIIGFKPEQIGCFCEFAGEQTGVYSHPIGLDYPTDAIYKMKLSTTLNSRILGIITSENKFGNLGDVVCKAVYDNYSLGDWLVPSPEGFCRKVTDDERTIISLNRIISPRVTVLYPNSEFVCCFM
jgi:hypothetical protein